ncbi:MAG: DUF4956 domain-containing protein [Flavobacteriaceae bacterium]|nr:DUF4956 domain-containing protein [Flavobacteriaceae bacterium]
MEFLDIPLFDNDFFKMIVRFTINIFFLMAIVQGVYYKYSKKSNYVFTYYLLGIVIFFLCFTLKKYELDLGMALGLFAIFGILRYRTTPLEVKDMTYLFIVIGISLINALSNKKMSFSELIAANFIILLATFLLERYWSRNSILTKVINYENIDNIHPKNHQKLKEDLESRLGIEIIEFEIGDVNFLRDTANIKIKFKK